MTTATTSSTKQQPQQQARPRVLLLLLTLGVFGIINTEMGVVGIIPQIATEFGVTVPQAGWTVSIFALMVALAAPVMPLLCSRFNRKRVMLFALGLFTVCSFTAMLTDSFAVLLASRALPALLHPVYVSIAFTMAAQSVAPERSSEAVSLVFVGVSAGMVLGVPVSSFVVSHSAVSVAFGLFALVTALVMALSVFVMPAKPVMPTQSSSASSSDSSAGTEVKAKSYKEQLQVLRRGQLWLALTTLIFLNGAVFGFFSFLSDFLLSVSQLSFDVVSALLLAYSIANIVGNLGVGKLIYRHQGKCIVLLPVILAVLYAVLYALGASTIAAATAVVVIGVFAGSVGVLGQSMLLKSASDAPEFANGLFLSGANAGTMMGTFLCGLFITSMGTRASIGGTMIFLLLSLLLGAAFVYRDRKAKMQANTEVSDTGAGQESVISAA